MARESSGAIDFRYDADWPGWEHTLAISLSLPLREKRYIGAPVPNVFDNLLPDNDGLRRQVTERVGASGADAYSLLEAIGRDCVGAPCSFSLAAPRRAQRVASTAIQSLTTRSALSSAIWRTIRMPSFATTISASRSLACRKRPPSFGGMISGCAPPVRRRPPTSSSRR